MQPEQELFDGGAPGGADADGGLSVSDLAPLFVLVPWIVNLAWVGYANLALS